jgi:Secretion system C-terminal sorting domain
MNVSAATGGVNVSVTAFCYTGLDGMDVNSSVIGTDVALNICYHTSDVVGSNPYYTLNRFIAIPATVTSYTLTVKAFERNFWEGSGVCFEANRLRDTKVLQFNMPVINPVYLASDYFYNQLNSTSLFPNPTTGTVNINFGQVLEQATLTLTNVLGQVVSSKTICNLEVATFEINEPNGVYFLKIESQNKQKKVFKIIKN